jgi:hypothetical protein
MAKFTGKNMVATFGSNGLTCLTSIESNESADIYTASCAGDTYKSRAVGLTDAQFTLTMMLDTTDYATLVPALAPGTTGAFSASTNGTNQGPQYAAASSYIESLAVSYPVEGFVSATVVVGVDGALTTS